MVKPVIKIFDDLTSLSRAAADLFTETVRQSISERGRFLVALSGGSTPMDTYRLLVHQAIDWEHVHVFWGDERCVPLDDPGSSYGQARKTWLDLVPIPEQNIHRIKADPSTTSGQRLGPAAAAMDYIILLKRFAEAPLDWPRFDLVFLGMGDDGHTASLFPGSPLDVTDAVIAVTVHYQDRPANRVTLTPVVFNAARHLLFLVSGESKSETLAHVLKGGYQPEGLPAQRIQPTEGELAWFVDAAAASKL
ncbi:MAG: 6-phosphogluconolactonase [Chloroflexota bacterium]